MVYKRKQLDGEKDTFIEYYCDSEDEDVVSNNNNSKKTGNTTPCVSKSTIPMPKAVILEVTKDHICLENFYSSSEEETDGHNNSEKEDECDECDLCGSLKTIEKLKKLECSGKHIVCLDCLFPEDSSKAFYCTICEEFGSEYKDYEKPRIEIYKRQTFGSEYPDPKTQFCDICLELACENDLLICGHHCCKSCIQKDYEESGENFYKCSTCLKPCNGNKVQEFVEKKRKDEMSTFKVEKRVFRGPLLD